MVKCPSCGNKGIFLKLLKCLVCDKEGCKKCMRTVLTLGAEGINGTRMPAIHLVTCSDKCYHKFKKRLIEDYPLSGLVGTTTNILRSEDQTSALIWNTACLDVLSSLSRQFAQFKKDLTSKGYSLHVVPPIDLWLSFQHRVHLVLAHNLEAAGRPLDAAKIYEDWGMYDEARKLREKEKQLIVKRVDISVNLNALLKQVKDGGIVVVYRCPHCSGKLKISKDTSIKSLKVCEHCGSEIEAMDLADFLRVALS